MKAPASSTNNSKHPIVDIELEALAVDDAPLVVLEDEDDDEGDKALVVVAAAAIACEDEELVEVELDADDATAA